MPSPGQYTRSPLCLLASGGSAPAAAWTLAPASGLVSRRGRGRWGQGAWGHWGCYCSGLRHTPGTCRCSASVSLTPSARVPTPVPFLFCVHLSVPSPVSELGTPLDLPGLGPQQKEPGQFIFRYLFSWTPVSASQLDPGQDPCPVRWPSPVLFGSQSVPPGLAAGESRGTDG